MVQLGDKRFNSCALYVVNEYSRVQNFQNGSEQCVVLGNRRSIHLSYSPIVSIRLVYIQVAESAEHSNSRDNAQKQPIRPTFFALRVDLSVKRGSCGRTISMNSFRTRESSRHETLPGRSSCDMLLSTSMVRRHLP